ncbi:(E2-independent) E3 ubiquitin-conjugating enzyme FATS [Misgurnus anguillicaudatus]|uniref:(E2-independent) E3 ubiquitin-conjugating enzyme FATS n=1 Tax=Misgurnus anguillicaudatus TaxID=75329 RepID=UPI003CCF67EF
MTHSKNKTSDCVTVIPPKRRAIVVTVNECTEQQSTTNNIIRFQASPGGWPVNQTDSSSSSKTSDRLFRSCAHIYVYPSQLFRSTLYLDKSLSIPLGQPQKYSGTLHRSTLSISLGKRASNRTLKGSGIIIQPKRSYSDWDISGIGVDGKEKLSRHPMDAPTSSAFRTNTSSVSNTQYSTLTSLTFRTRCHSSSASFRVNGKANDVLRPPQSNLRAIQAFSKHSAPVLSKMVESPAIFKTISSAGSVEDLRHRNTATDPDLQSPEAKTLSKQIWVPQVRVRVPREVRTVSHTAEKIRRGIEWSVSPHLINCTCASRPDQYNTKPQSLSLREALELFRPDFISRSQNRLRRLEQRARQRQSLQTSEFSMVVETANFRPNCTKPHPLSDNLFKPRDRAISGKEMQWRSRRIYKKLPEVTKKKEDEKKRQMSQTNRLRVEVFKKKLLDQVLQRHSD